MGASLWHGVAGARKPLLQVDAASQGLFIGGSSIVGAGLGLFAAKPFTRGEIVCWYGGTIMYRSLAKENSKYQRWGPIGFEVTRETFNTWALQLYPGSFDETGSGLGPLVENVWIVAAPFCAGGLVNDYRRVYTADKESVDSSGVRESNVELTTEKPEDCMQRLRERPWFAHLAATRDIGVGEELFVNYGR